MNDDKKRVKVINAYETILFLEKYCCFFTQCGV